MAQRILRRRQPSQAERVLELGAVVVVVVDDVVGVLVGLVVGLLLVLLLFVLLLLALSGPLVVSGKSFDMGFGLRIRSVVVVVVVVLVVGGVVLFEGVDEDLRECHWGE